MRYSYKINNINNFDVELLREQMIAAGLRVNAVYAGNGALTIETPAALTAADKAAFSSVINAHSPVWFSWIENGKQLQEKVNCASDVDRITARRIRGAIGGDDPVQEQLKILRLAAFAHEVRLRQLEGKNPSATDVATASAITTQMLSVNTSVEAIRQEGQAFKTGKGW